MVVVEVPEEARMPLTVQQLHTRQDQRLDMITIGAGMTSSPGSLTLLLVRTITDLKPRLSRTTGPLIQSHRALLLILRAKVIGTTIPVLWPRTNGGGNRFTIMTRCILWVYSSLGLISVIIVTLLYSTSLL